MHRHVMSRDASCQLTACSIKVTTDCSVVIRLLASKLIPQILWGILQAPRPRVTPSNIDDARSVTSLVVMDMM